jgi:hypothetical protein
MVSTIPVPSTGWEFVPDFDGTIVMGVPGSVALGATVIRDSNDYDPTNVAFGTGSTALTFSHYYPQARNIIAFSCGIATNTGNMWLESSVDTTDGLGGTWVQQKTGAELTTMGYAALTNAASRKFTALPISNVRGFRLRSSSSYLNVYGFHVWGTYTPSNQLMMWHPTLDQPLTAQDCDHGDMTRGSLSNKNFRVKNVSAFTANSVQVALATPQYAGAQAGSILIYNSTNATFHNIGNLTAGSISGVVTCRRTMSPTAIYGDKGTVRVTAIAGSWT